MWGDDKAEAKHKVVEYINQQNLRIVKELEPSICFKMIKDINANDSSMVHAVNENNPK